MQVETIRVVSPVTDENPLGYVVINKSDFVEGEHEPWADPDADSDPLRVAKGPGGRLYLKRGKDIVSGPYDTQEDADAALAAG